MPVNLILSVAILGAVLLDAALVVRQRRHRKAAMSVPGSPAGSGPAGGDAPALAGLAATDSPSAPSRPPGLTPPARASESAQTPAWRHQTGFGDGQARATGAGEQAQQVTEIRSDEPMLPARGAEDDGLRARGAEDDRLQARGAEDHKPQARSADNDTPTAAVAPWTASPILAGAADPIVAGAADEPAAGDHGRGSVRRSQWSGPSAGASGGRPGRRKR
jgi:hypothetical protein